MLCYFLVMSCFLIHHNHDKAIDLATQMLHRYSEIYSKKWLDMMRCKLGLFDADKEDENLISALLDWMQKHQLDYTNTFRELATMDLLSQKPYDDVFFVKWYQDWQTRLIKNMKPLQSARGLMNSTNPLIIPRNHKVEEVLQAASNGDFTPMKLLLNALQEPYKDQGNLQAYQSGPEPSQRVYQTFCGT